VPFVIKATYGNDVAFKTPYHQA